MVANLLLLQVAGVQAKELASPFVQAGILGILVLVEAGVIAFLFMQKEKQRERYEAKLEALNLARLEERNMRLADQQKNQEVLLEVHDRMHEQNEKRDEVFKRVLDRLEIDTHRRR